MKYIKYFLESNSSGDISIELLSKKLPEGFKVVLEGYNSIMITKLLTNKEDIDEYKRRLISRNLSEKEIEEFFNIMTDSFYIIELDEFIEYLEKIYYVRDSSKVPTDVDESITELILELRLKINNKDKINEFVKTNLAYLSDEYPFKFDIHHLDLTSFGFYNCSITFEESIDLDSIRDYIIPFLYMAESELGLFNYGNNRGCLFLTTVSSGNINLDINKLDTMGNCVIKSINFFVVE